MKARFCARCGSVLPVLEGAGRPPRFCSTTCRRGHHDPINLERAKLARIERRRSGRPCKTCGKLFAIQVGMERYCSESCKKPRRSLPTSECAYCGAVFEKRHPLHLTCGRACSRRRYHSTLVARLSTRVRAAMRRGLRDRKGGRSWESVVGYTLQELFDHLQSQFEPGMSWDRMHEWHIDHVRPLSSFQMERVGDSQFMEAWALNNLRPLWASENLRKGARYAAPTETEQSQDHQRKSAA